MNYVANEIYFRACPEKKEKIKLRQQNECKQRIFLQVKNFTVEVILAIKIAFSIIFNKSKKSILFVFMNFV